MSKLFNSQKIYGLAPMAGYTDSPFRAICKDFGADLVYSEMISARGIVEDHKRYKTKSLSLANFSQDERPIFIQIFGNEPQIMAEASQIICDLHDPNGIDINMGCPARKIIGNNYGASLMLDKQLASDIVKAVKPVIGNRILSVKTRLGWEDKNEIFDFAKKLEESGLDLIAVHCRTKQQGFSGKPDWSKAAELKRKLSIPVLVNGGISSWRDAVKCVEQTSADGVLIGQAALGRPWIFKEIKHSRDIVFDLKVICDVCLKQIDLFVNCRKNFPEIKKQILCYFRGIDNSHELRRSVASSQNVGELISYLSSL